MRHEEKKVGKREGGRLQRRGDDREERGRKVTKKR